MTLRSLRVPPLHLADLGLGKLAEAMSLTDAAVSAVRRERSLALNPPGYRPPEHRNLQPHSYGDLLDLLLQEPEASRVARMGEAVEVLVGRQPSCRIAGMMLSYQPDMMERFDQQMLRASRASMQFCHWAHAGLVLERPHGSKWHEARETAARGELAVCGYGPQSPPQDSVPIEVEGVFLVEHDWQAALRADEGGEVRWPYPTWVLEFRLSGRRVCALLIDPTDLELGVVVSRVRSSVPYLLFFVETKYEGWSLPCTFDFVEGRWQRYGSRRHVLEAQAEDALLAVVAPQLRAMCIALDAEVVEREVVRAPERLNRARDKKGHLPLSDYTVLNLARRTVRGDRAPDRASEEKRQSPRLHFRRGHWRHYDTRRVWINWQLVGDPDLGFVNKHYRL